MRMKVPSPNDNCCHACAIAIDVENPSRMSKSNQSLAYSRKTGATGKAAQHPNLTRTFYCFRLIGVVAKTPDRHYSF